MSEEGVITKLDVAQLLKDLKEEDLEPGDGIAQRQLLVNTTWSVWDQLGAVETNPSVSEEEADELLEEMPVSFDDFV